MTSFKKVLSIGAAVLMLGATSVTAFAASNYNTPAEAVAGITGRTVEDVTAERYEQSKTYGTIADEAGKLEEFQKETLEMKKDILAARVSAGTMTQIEADLVIKAIEENQALCDGTGIGGCGMGGGFGAGRGQGAGQGMGRGRGQRFRDGSCIVS